MPIDIVLPIRVKSVKTIEPSESNEIPQASHAKGFQAGYEEGRLRAEWEAHRQRDQDKKRIEELVNALDKLHQEFESLLQDHLPDLIHGAVNRVFRQHHFTNEEISSEVITLLQEMEEAGHIHVECSPSTLKELQTRLEECDQVPKSARWSLKENVALGPGEFLIKSDLGDVDGRHSTRIREIHHILERK